VGQLGRRVLDKRIHADLASVIKVLEALELDIRVVGTKDKLAERKKSKQRPISTTLLLPLQLVQQKLRRAFLSSSRLWLFLSSFHSTFL